MPNSRSNLLTSQSSTRQTFEHELSKKRTEYAVGTIDRHGADAILEIGPGLMPVVTGVVGFFAYTAVDPAEEFVERIREVDDDRVSAIHGTIEEVSEGMDGSYDVIVASSVLHEVPSPDTFLRAVRSVADRGTVVHLNVPNARSLHRLLTDHLGLIEDVYTMSEMDERFDRQEHFDRDSFASLVMDAGFEVERFDTYVVKPFSNEQMDLLVEEGGAPDDLVDGLDDLVEHVPGIGTEMLIKAVPR